ncbi:hypothetical protein OESDEN_12410 [Oesophagostomum dentatum]|uniref:Sulfatase N-terminal domain-containing protein n=1 Tax=Oesophagostomum dentatum TaxID=61180 RepID=A0A0B1SWA4_OESDE|nr:hypothetical protein OESDEN_12410 [Oesophagostomum dentatum]
MDAVEFRMLNKVGANTRPNAFPLLLGKTTETVDRSVMNLEEIKPDFSEQQFCRTYLDNELYIPKEYLDAGYMFSNSFIIFLGDHGPRFGKEANARVNDAEQRNPFLYIVIPEHLRYSPMHEQLVQNSEELLTHHDLHATLKDILYFQPASNFTELEFKVFDSNKRGSSVLRRYEEGVKRSCKTLPIPFQYCICQYVTSKVDDKELKWELGSFAADQLDLILKSEGVSSMCEITTIGLAK